MKTQVGKALSFTLFIHLSLFFFPGRLRGGPHSVNHPCQAVDLVEHLPESHPAALLLPAAAVAWLAFALPRCFIYLLIYSLVPRLPAPSVPLSIPLSPSRNNHRRRPQEDGAERRSLDICDKPPPGQRGRGIIDIPD